MDLSVIVCVYNTDEKMFDDCLKSIFLSSLKNIEVIVIDDGSTKDYTKLQKKYLKAKFIKTENQGTLKARMFGIKQAKCDCIAFVDSDDTISFDYFEALLSRKKQTGAEVVINDWAFQTEQTRYVCKNDSTIKTTFKCNADSAFYRFFAQRGLEHSYYVLWNKIFDKNVLLNAASEIEKIDFAKFGLERLVFAEDVLITYYVMKNVNVLTNVHVGYYFYHIHSSQEIYVSSAEKLKKQILSMTAVFDEIESDLIKTQKYEIVKDNFVYWKNLLCSGNYATAKHSKYTNLIPYIKEKYKISKIKNLPIGYGRAYTSQKVLPNNIEQLDDEIKRVCLSNKFLKVYARKGSYAFERLQMIKIFLNKKFELVKSKKYATTIISKQKVSLKQQILHNYIVYKIGMFLFPKGSKIRKKLKTVL